MDNNFKWTDRNVCPTNTDNILLNLTVKFLGVLLNLVENGKSSIS